MTSLESLRRQYRYLEPFERATMLVEAFGRMDESAVDALQPTSLREALLVAHHEQAFGMLACTAVHESQRAELLVWVALNTIKDRYIQNLKEGKGFPSKDDTEVQRNLDLMQEGIRRAGAWIYALAELDKEKGSSCLQYARIFARSHVDVMLESVPDDYRSEMESLRALWDAWTKQ